MIRTLVHAPNSVTREFDLAGAAEAAGLDVRRITIDDDGRFDVPALVEAAGSEVAGSKVAYRCAGGPLAAAINAGAAIGLLGATAKWFVDLPREVTGRDWSLVDVAGARAMVARAPAFVKLAEAKFRALPARRYRTVTELDAALSFVHARSSLVLIATCDWLPIASEYRVFTIAREAVAWSPYLVHDDPWSPLLRTHRASFHEEAAAFVAATLAALPAAQVPPTAVLDVARLDDDRFVVLEVNHVWSSGLYGCEPARALQAVVAAAEGNQQEKLGPWVWRPDPAASALHR